MTKAKAMKKAKMGANVMSEYCDTFFCGGILMRAFLTFRDEGIAREVASEATTSAQYVGIPIDAEDITIQERWERILSSLSDVPIKWNGEVYTYNKIP